MKHNASSTDIWNSISLEVRLLLLCSVNTVLKNENVVVSMSFKDDCAYNHTNDEVTMDVFTLDNGHIGFWFNPKLTEEEFKDFKEKKLGLLGNNLLLISLPESMKEGLSEGVSGDPHLPVCAVQCLTGIRWAELLRKNQPILAAMQQAPEGTSLTAILKSTPHELDEGIDLSNWF